MDRLRVYTSTIRFYLRTSLEPESSGDTRGAPVVKYVYMMPEQLGRTLLCNKLVTGTVGALYIVFFVPFTRNLYVVFVW